MATPNSPLNVDPAGKSLIKLLWRNRESLSKKETKPSKDVWDITDVVARAVIALLTVVGVIVIPIVVAKIGGKIQHAVTSQTGKIQESIAVQNTGKDYMQLALGILEKRDLPEDMAKNLGLRKWAVGLLKYYSPVKLDENTAGQLVNGEVEIPLMSDTSQEQWWLTPDSNSAFTVRGPHGGRISSVSKNGVLTVQGLFKVQTQIKSPKGMLVSADGYELIVYDDQTLELYFTEADTSRGQPRIAAPVRISPPNGISRITFSNSERAASEGQLHPVTMIIVTGTDNKEIRYDLDGNVIK
jgi:hypothetical protein